MLDTIYVVRNFDPENPASLSQTDLLSRSDGVLFVLQQLRGEWRALAVVLHLLPRFIRDWGYRAIASNRYRIFGRYATCPVPDQSVRSRFLDL
jgi:predicted DCC family thiol-disulfide oxidoreductase YuxK